MIKRRRRFKQTTSFQDRLSAFAQELREEALRLPPSRQREELLRRASRADTAAHLDDWVRSPGLQPPTLR
jgi:hypothetical protein